MENYSIIIPSYTVGPESYKEMKTYCPLYGKTAVVIGGRRAMAAAREDLQKGADEAGIRILDYVLYGPECTHEAAQALTELEAVKQAEMIFAVGGGKAIDTAKLVSIAMEKPYFSFPTIASNCSASSSISIVYNTDGSFREFVHFLASSRHVFINTRIIAEAPSQYLWAGIGDTYAKYYEVSVSAKGEILEHFKAMGVTLCRQCMETLINFGAKALEDNKAKKASFELEQAALAIVITTGWVSMLVARDHTMDYNGGIAHALFYALCSIPGFDEDHLHGVVVGFGVLLLLLIDGQEEECERLKAFNRTVGLPTSFEEVGVTLADVEKVAPIIVEDEDLEHYPYKVTVDMIMTAARRLEK